MDISKKRPWVRAWLGSVILSAIGLLSPLVFADFEKGFTYYNSGHLTEAVAEWTTDANKGNLDAQYNLGCMYENGLGVPQDAKKAVYWYTLSAEQGDSSAQFNLGSMYLHGKGIEPNLELAYIWGNLAAANGAEPNVRDAAAEKLNSEQLARAQKMSSDWAAAHP